MDDFRARERSKSAGPNSRPSELRKRRRHRGVPTSVRRGRVGGGKHVAVNFPLTLFPAEDEQLVVCLPRHLMSCEDFLLSGRSSTPVSQVAHLHDFVDRENDVQFDGLGTVLVPRLHRFAANEGFRILGNKDWIASIQRHDSRWIVRIERLLVGLEEVRDFLIRTFRWFRFRGNWFQRVLGTARGSVRDGEA
jgi:hypothetical protein